MSRLRNEGLECVVLRTLEDVQGNANSISEMGLGAQCCGDSSHKSECVSSEEHAL